MQLHETVAALAPAPMDRALLTAPTGVSLDVALPGTAWGVSRFALDVALLDAAAQAGATVRTGATALDVTHDAEGCTVALRQGKERETLRARAAIGACGRHPPTALRAQAEAASAREQPRHVGIKCHYRGIAMPPRVELYLFPGGYVGVNPVEDGRVNVCLLATYQAFTAAGGSAAALLGAIRHWNPALQRRLAGGQELPDTQATVAAVNTARPMIPWEGIARLGDSATMIPPLCGDGMAMALRSAEICAPLAHAYLNGSITLTEWEQQYRQHWHAEFNQIVRVGRALQACLIRPGLAESALVLGNLLPVLARKVVHHTRGTVRPDARPTSTLQTA
jgi:flavin-dependent dehydrogenase